MEKVTQRISTTNPASDGSDLQAMLCVAVQCACSVEKVYCMEAWKMKLHVTSGDTVCKGCGGGCVPGRFYFHVTPLSEARC